MSRLKRGMASLLAVLMLLSVMLPAALAEETAWLKLETPEKGTETAQEESLEETGEEIQEKQSDFPAADEAEITVADETEETVDPQDLELAALHVTVNGEDAPVYTPADEATLLPIEEHRGFILDLSGYLPSELENVSIADCVLVNTKDDSGNLINIGDGNIAVWARWGYYAMLEDGTLESRYDSDSYTLLGGGTTFDLSDEDIYNAAADSYLELIVGTGDQLDTSNTRFIINVKTTGGDIFDVQSESIEFMRTDSTRPSKSRIWFSEEFFWFYRLPISGESPWDEESAFPITMKFKDGVKLAEEKNISVEVFEGYYKTAEQARAAANITSQIWNGTGYSREFTLKKGFTQTPAVTVLLSRGESVTTIPFYIYANKYSDSVYGKEVYQLTANSDGTYGHESVSYLSGSQQKDNVHIDTYMLKNSSYKADANYYARLRYMHNDAEVQDFNAYVKCAVVGKYTAAEAAGQNDIKDRLFSSGYLANYSGDGVIFTIVGKDDVAHHVGIRLVDNDGSDDYVSHTTYMNMLYARKNVVDGEENKPGFSYDYHDIQSPNKSWSDLDSYAGTYQTVFLLDRDSQGYGSIVKPVEDGAIIYPYFYANEKIRVYANETVEDTDKIDQSSGKIQVSGETPHIFHSGIPIQYTAYAEDGEHYQNYWVTFVTQSQGSKLFVNGVTNAIDAHKEDDGNGGRIARREVRLEDSNSYHDILIANTGDTTMEGLYVRLENGAKGVVLDDYWTIKEDGARSLLPFTTTESRQLDSSSYASYGELPNMAKIRLRPEMVDGKMYEGLIDAVLVIGYTGGNGTSGEEVRVKLSGVSGKLQITTDKLREGVKYVPYLTAIQTNFIGSSDINSRIKFSIVEGNSETNIALLPTGELYGLPKTDGEWEFTVQARYEDPTGRLSGEALGQLTASQKFTLTVHDNTDKNVRIVPGANEYSYDVRQFVGEESTPYHYEISTYGDKVFWSEGEHSEFVNFYMDGELLADGQDYSHAPGSTVITIFADTTAKKGEGKHTIAAEFFKDGTGASKQDMKTSAQNLYVKASATRPGSSGGSTSGGNTSGGNTSGGSTSGGNNSGGSSKPGIVSNPATAPGTSGGSDTPSTSREPFSDVAKGNWFYDDVVWAKEMGIMKGVSGSRFNPGATISEATIVTTLARLVGIDEDSYAGEADPDVEPGKWYTVGAIWAKRIGLLPNGTSFTGENPITREEMAIMLVKFLRSLGLDTDPPENPKVFADAELMSADGNAAFQTLYRLKIFKGVGKSHMDPLGATTRAQFAALMHRIYDIING